MLAFLSPAGLSFAVNNISLRTSGIFKVIRLPFSATRFGMRKEWTLSPVAFFVTVGQSLSLQKAGWFYPVKAPGAESIQPILPGVRRLGGPISGLHRRSIPLGFLWRIDWFVKEDR